MTYLNSHPQEYIIKQKRICSSLSFQIQAELLTIQFMIYNNNMIITIILFVVDYLVLEINDISLLPIHTIYLIFLAYILWKRKQPESYSLTMEQITKKYQSRSLTLSQCSICCKAKPPRYYHCRHCNKCVYRLDHHCHFVGNCIGQYNTKVYVHFLLNLFLHSLAIVIVAGVHYQGLLDFKSRQALFWLVLLPTLFALYETQRLLRAFWLTVKRNQTLIQSYKQVRGQKFKTLTLFQSYFGKKSLKWLLPTFQKDKHCDIFQNVYPISQKTIVKQYAYADEYLYGPDEQDELFEQKQE